jgi:hypothetical protein
MSQHIEHSLHDKGIHEITFWEANHDAVDTYINLMESLITEIMESDAPQKCRLLLNLTQTQDLPAFAYVTKQGRKMLHGHLKDREKLHLKAAFLARHDEMLVLSLAENFLKLMPVDMDMKIFDENQRDEATTWLLSEK